RGRPVRRGRRRGARGRDRVRRDRRRGSRRGQAHQGRGRQGQAGVRQAAQALTPTHRKGHQEMNGTIGMGGDLSVLRLPALKPRPARSVRLPGKLGRFWFTRDPGDARLFSSEYFMSALRLVHRGADGAVKDVRDLGSGLVTNAGVNLMSNDFSWTTCTLKSANFHAIGTGSTAAAASDAFLQTPQGSTNLSGTTNGYMTGTQSVVANATGSPFSPIYQTVATFTATGAIAVTEWILAAGNFATITHTATATSATSLSDTTNSPFTSGM